MTRVNIPPDTIILIAALLHSRTQTWGQQRRAFRSAKQDTSVGNHERGDGRVAAYAFTGMRIDTGL